jgi:hypothetical protein
MCGLDSFGSGQGQFPVSYEYGMVKDPRVQYKTGNFLINVSLLLSQESVCCMQLVSQFARLLAELQLVLGGILVLFWVPEHLFGTYFKYAYVEH